MTDTIRRFQDPDEVTVMAMGRVDTVTIGGLTVGRARYLPGWRWSEHVGAASGQRFCSASHVGIVISGRNRIEMADGRTFEIGPGDIFEIGPDHDSVVIGDEPYESLHLAGVEEYVHGAVGETLEGGAG